MEEKKSKPVVVVGGGVGLAGLLVALEMMNSPIMAADPRPRTPRRLPIDHVPVALPALDRSKDGPHQGAREKARRLKRMQKAKSK